MQVLTDEEIAENLSVLTDQVLKKYLIDEVNKLTWTFAKTYPKHPHFYIIRDKTAEERIYVELFEAIEMYGVIEYFYKRPMKYLYLGDGYKYWHMCGDEQGNINTKWTIKDSKVINRALHENKY